MGYRPVLVARFHHCEHLLASHEEAWIATMPRNLGGVPILRGIRRTVRMLASDPLGSLNLGILWK